VIAFERRLGHKAVHDRQPRVRSLGHADLEDCTLALACACRLGFFAPPRRALLTVYPTMLGRRRVKSKLLPLGSSLYAAVRSIVEALRARYQPPEEVPSDMVRLLTQLNESTEPELQLPQR
jgi:hypothetical protein